MKVEGRIMDEEKCKLSVYLGFYERGKLNEEQMVV